MLLELQSNRACTAAEHWCTHYRTQFESGCRCCDACRLAARIAAARRHRAAEVTRDRYFTPRAIELLAAAPQYCAGTNIQRDQLLRVSFIVERGFLRAVDAQTTCRLRLVLRLAPESCATARHLEEAQVGSFSSCLQTILDGASLKGVPCTDSGPGHQQQADCAEAYC